MAWVLKVGGTTIAVPKNVVLQRFVPFVRHGIPTLGFAARGGKIGTLPDPYLGKDVELTYSGVKKFVGDCISVNVAFDDRLGWIRQYQCFGLKHRGDKIPVTDATSLSDSAQFNLTPEDPDYNPTRAGRTVGQMITAVLTMTVNATALDGYGIGAYTSLSPPTLPAATVADLAALSLICPHSITIMGERLLAAIEDFVAQVAPGIGLYIDPATGTLRFLGATSSPINLDCGVDPVGLPSFARDTGRCSQRVVVRGQPIAVMFLLKLSQGQLTENFGHDGLDNTAAKAAWKSTDFTTNVSYQDVGTCTCPATTTVTVTSGDPAKTWTANYWDQTSTGHKGSVNLYYNGGAGLSLCWTAKVVSNTSLTAGGTSNLVLDAALPHTNFNKYTLSGFAAGASVVWRKYQITDTALWPLVVNQATYPQAFTNAGGGVSMTSSPIGSVLWPASSAGGPPYLQFPIPFIYDGAGNLLFSSPTFTTANNRSPADVWALLPINTGSLHVAYPLDVAGAPVYGGTSHTTEGLADTLVITVPQWRDPADTAAMQAFAMNWYQAIKDTSIEGTVTYHGLMTAALTYLPFPLSLDFSASGFDVPYMQDSFRTVTEAEVTWQDGATLHTTRLRFSNHIDHYSVDQFLHPARTGITWGYIEGGAQLFGQFAGRSMGISPAGGLATSGAMAGLDDFRGQVGAGLGAMRGLTSEGLGGMRGLTGGGLGAMRDLTGAGLGAMNAAGGTGNGKGGGGDFDMGGFGAGGFTPGSNRRESQGDRAPGGLTQIRPETPEDTKRRQERQPQAPQMTRKEAARQDQDRRNAIPGGAQPQERAPQMTRADAEREDRERRAKINEDQG